MPEFKELLGASCWGIFGLWSRNGQQHTCSWSPGSAHFILVSWRFAETGQEGSGFPRT